MKTTTAIKTLQKMFPDIHGIKAGSEWSGKDEDSIFLGDAAEGGEIEGMYAADYNVGWQGDYKSFGVHTKLNDALTEMGFFAEWYDSGTLIAYRL